MSSEIKNHDTEKNSENKQSRAFDERIEVKNKGEKADTTDTKANETKNPETQKNNVNQETEHRYDGLSEAEKKQLQKETGWSNKVVDFIRSPEEAKIYKEANLKEAEINGRTCLIRSDIDMDAVDEDGLTNKERMEDGKAPLVDGKPIELHHIGQKEDSPLAELSHDEHHSKENFTVLHDNSKESEVDHGSNFAKCRQDHWEARSEEGDKNNDTAK